MPASFQCTLVTPEAEVFEQPVASVVLPAHDGKVGILNQRAPLLTKLGFGRLTVTDEAGTSTDYFVASGFAQMLGNHLTILTDEATPVADLDAADAQRELDEAVATEADDPAAKTLRDKRIERARGLVTVTSA